jgi:hypothetical protein
MAAAFARCGSKEKHRIGTADKRLRSAAIVWVCAACLVLPTIALVVGANLARFDGS